MRLSGTASGLPDDRFLLALVSAEGSDIARVTVAVQDGQWQLELLPGYSGVPTEVSIRALATDATITTPYYQRLVLLGSLKYRPEGRFAQITGGIAADGSAGGESLQISGRSSGLADGELRLQLLNTDRAVISETSIATHNPYLLDEMPWTADIDTESYTGPARLQLVDPGGEMLDSRPVTLDTAAG